MVQHKGCLTRCVHLGHGLTATEFALHCTVGDKPAPNFVTENETNAGECEKQGSLQTTRSSLASCSNWCDSTVR